MNSYGILKTTLTGHIARTMKLSSGYDAKKAKVRCDELNRVQKPKNTE